MGLMAFHYEEPTGYEDRPKVAVNICKRELITATAQIVRNGGETNLHSHAGTDAVWVVLGGRAAFYDEDGGRRELGLHDGIVIPAGTKYWFESVGDEALEILRVGANDPRVARTANANPVPAERAERFGPTPHLEVEEIPVSVTA